MKFIFTFLLSISCLLTQAQIGGGWDWVFNTGGSGPTIQHLAYKADGDLAFAGTALTAIKFGNTTLTAPNVLSFPGSVKFFGKISVTGEPTILRSYVNPSFSIDCATTDSSGNFYFGGGVTNTLIADFGNGITNTPNANLGYIAKLDASGNAQWVKTFEFGGTGTAGMQVHRIAVSKQGNIFFAGFNPNIAVLNSKYNAPIYKLDNNGNTLWFKDVLNGGIFSNFQETKYSLNDKFIDDNENVHLLTNNQSQTMVFNGESITAPLSIIGGSNYTFHISLDANGNKRFANGYRGGGNGLYVDRVSGNCLLYWGQYEVNAGTVLATVPTYTIGSNTNFFSGYLLLNSNGNTLLKTTSPFVTNGLDIKLVILKPNGSLAILNTIPLSVNYGIGTDYLQINDAINRTASIIETDSNWNLTKFISGGKSPQTASQVLVAKGNDYVLVSDFGTISTTQLPTTQFGTTTLTGFNAATNFNTTYTGGVRKDIAIAKCNSANFPVIGTTTWLGANTNWNDAANWTNGVPTNAVKAVFNGSTANYPTTFTSPTSGTLQINAGASITLPTTLTIAGGIKNEGTIKINNPGFFQGFGAKEWVGNGTVEFLGTSAALFFMANPFTNALVLNASLTAYYDMAIKGITFNATSAKFDMGAKTITITDPSPTSIVGVSATNYFTNGTLKRAINNSGIYEFPVGTSSNFQSATITANGLVGVSTIAVKHTSGAVTGTAPNAIFNGVAITSTLNGGWYSINPNVQPTAGNYNITLKIKGSSNTASTPSRYAVIKRDNSTTPWEVQGTYVLPTTDGTTVTATANELNSFSDFAIGIGSNPLPVHFVFFNTKANEATAQLNWATTTEINNKGFNVQHSIDGLTFNNLGFVSGNNNSTQLNSYTFTHASPINGNNYYRLQQIDNDGKQTYSSLQVLNFSQIQTSLIVYPNPVISTIYFNKNFEKGTSLQIINNEGKMVDFSVFSGNFYQPKKSLKGLFKLFITEANGNRFSTSILLQ